ncbi:MAG: beta-N-acetylglucosaminidase, partial [Schleiferiaceae bacterium]|nr:beta-N-acetylglucosaminidase [Schleiferiaceae bacterium]
MMHQAFLFRRLLPLVALPLLSATQDHSLVDSAADAHLRAMFGQCIMVAAYSNGDAAHMDQLADWTRNGLVGGMIWMQGGPERQRQAINRLQKLAEQPLLMAQDAEWGAAMRLDSLSRLPWPLTLGATHDSALAWRYGQALGAESKSLGIHVNFSPVVDLNTNPNNPIIGQRAIGSNTKLVNAMSSAMIAGFHSEAVMA